MSRSLLPSLLLLFAATSLVADEANELRELLAQDRYPEASRAGETLLQNNPTDHFSPNMHFRIGVEHRKAKHPKVAPLRRPA